MKSHNQKSLRSISKARAWYGFGLFLSIGFLFAPQIVSADLTSPVPVVTGSQYGVSSSLGERECSSGDEDCLAWQGGEVDHHRRIVRITPATKDLLVVAVVNNSTSISNCGSPTYVCRLEFKVSENNGLTWSQALEGSTPWLPIMGPKFDYTLYSSPNGQDIWVSYTYAKDLGTGTFTKSRIQKLKLNPSTNKSWILDGNPHEPSAGCNGSTITRCAGLTGAAVQVLQSGTVRVWGLSSYYVVGFYRQYVVVYSDDFSATNPTWNISTGFGATNICNLANCPDGPFIGSSFRGEFFPVGNKMVPGFVFSSPRRYQGCTEVDAGAGMRIMTLSSTEATSWAVTTGPTHGLVDIFPYYYSFGGVFTPCATLAPNFQSAFNRLDFSVASIPTGDLTSRIVVAYSGGVNSSGTENNNKIQAMNCSASIDNIAGAPNNSTFTCTGPVNVNASLPTHASPSVGFYNSNAWIAAKRSGVGNTRLDFFEETSTPPTWTWSALTTFTASYTPNIASPSVVSDAGSMQTNLDVIPTVWSQLSGSKVAFVDNSGGVNIGSPAKSANPILGYGWASNFGWLSLNCINQPTPDCSNLFGLGIGATAHGDNDVDNPNETSELPNLNTLSPTTAKTFPLGGYAWSSNAGFLSFERRDSIYNCGGAVDCGDADSYTDDNDFGNPPGAAYHNATAATANIPTAKYDTASQHVYGWGRFINLCNYDSVNFRCRDKDEGWVRMRGYYTTSAPSQTGDLTGTNTVTLDTPCAEFTTGEVVAIGDDYSVVNNCTGSTLNLSIDVPYSASTPVTVFDVTGKEYGLDAFWTGDHYELAGWAWSSNYGWIRFNPLIFVGFAWLETLFGNVYSGGDVKLPSPENLSNVRYNECDPEDDGAADSPCYVATYRIEANNAISAVQSSGTGFIGTPPTSGGAVILKSGVDAGTYTCNPTAEPSKTYDAKYCVLDTPNASFFNRLVDPIPFPTVGSTTVTYRNALGKLDVGGLTNILQSSTGYNFVTNPSRGYLGLSNGDKNRFGSTVYKTKLVSGLPVDWTTNEISGWKNAIWPGATAPVLPLNVLTDTSAVSEKAPLRSQVVHVQGDLTVDGEHATSNVLNLVANSLTVTGASGVFPSQGALGSGTVSCAGCAIILDPGGPNEEYFSYTTYTDNGGNTGIFTGVKAIKACAPACTHAAGQNVRWVWRLPYADNGTDNIAQRVTVVVDGDLDIQYNIIAADPAKDQDLGNGACPAATSPFVCPDSIRDLPTIAFIVKGNVTIAKEVNKVTGAFIVTSRDTTKTADSTLCTNNYGNNCGGAFKTGSDNDASLCTVTSPTCRPLTIIGLLFARQLSFQRIGNLRENNTAAERVIADERLFLNPPPGLEDVTKALPNPTRTLP